VPVSRANAATILSAEISEPRTGAWHADVNLDADALASPVTLTVAGVTYKGTVLRSGVHGGRFGARIVGGNGGLSKELPAKNYSTPGSTKLSVVLADILRECGETLSPTAEVATTSRTLAKWHRSAGPASHALVSLLDAAGACFRVLRDGAIWVGVQTYPETKIAHTVIDEDWVAGIITIATEAPTLEPGVTFRGQKIESVVHRLEPNSLRTEAHATSTKSVLNTFLAGIRQQIDYSRLYPARVTLQNPDGSLQLVPDDEAMKGAGLDHIPIRHGIPGITLENIPKGARVRLGFEGGDPASPYAALWDTDTGSGVTIVVHAAHIKLGGSDAAQAALLGPDVLQWLNAHVHPTGVGPSGPPTVPATELLTSQITTLK
jgi:hypothetical protein